MSCDKSFDLVAYLKGELAEGERAGVRQHVEACASCTRELTKLDGVLKALGRLKTEEVAVSGDFKWRVRAAFVEAHPEFLERRVGAGAESRSIWQSLREQFQFVPAWAVSLAVHVLLLAAAAIVFFTPKSGQEEWRRTVEVAAPKDGPPLPEFAPPDVLSGNEAPKPFDLESPPPLPFDPDRPRDPRDPMRPDGRHFQDRRFEGPKWSPAIKGNRFSGLAGWRRARKAEAGAGVRSAVEPALDWLARQQESEGYWDPAKFGGKREYTIGVTGLALMAFLGNGESPSEGAHALQVKLGIEYLLRQQRATGLIGPDTTSAMYNHGVAAAALHECLLVTGDENLDAPCAAAAGYTLKAQNDAGGWGYVAGSEDCDTSVGVWQILVLRLALGTGNRSVVPALNAAHRRVELATDSSGQVGYRGRGQYPNGPYALTAVGAFATLLSKPVPDVSVLDRQAGVIVRGLEELPVSGDPTRFGSNDLVFAAFGSLVVHQTGGARQADWDRRVTQPLMDAQQRDGSWPAGFDRWSSYGGQVYTTAMATIALESGWRYPALAQ